MIHSQPIPWFPPSQVALGYFQAWGSHKSLGILAGMIWECCHGIEREFVWRSGKVLLLGVAMEFWKSFRDVQTRTSLLFPWFFHLQRQSQCGVDRPENWEFVLPVQLCHSMNDSSNNRTFFSPFFSRETASRVLISSWCGWMKTAERNQLQDCE